MANENKTLDKETIADIVTQAMDNYLKNNAESDDVVESEDIQSQVEEPQVEENITEPVVDSITEPVEDLTTTIDTDIKPINEENTDTEVESEVTDMVENQISQCGDFNFLGLDINIVQNGDKFDVTIKKDDKEKTETIDSAELNNIFGLIENFFYDVVIDENVDDDKEKEENEETLDDEIKEEEEKKEEEEEEEEEKEEEEKEENTKNVTMESLRFKYADKVNEIFEHGLEAKEIALDMVKDTILANTVKELISKTEEKDTILANKKDELRQETQKYLVANKLNSNLENFNTLLESSIKSVKQDLLDNIYNAETAKKILNRYNSIMSKIITTNNAETILAGIEAINNTQNTILAYKKDKMNKKTLVESKTNNNIIKKEINTSSIPIIEKKNIINSDGWKNNDTLLSKNRGYDSIEEMSAELLKIAGIKK